MFNPKKTCLSMIAFTLFTSITFAAPTPAPSFSPYADLTINARWDSHYQDTEPMDLAQIAQAAGNKSYHLAFITDAGSCVPAWGGQTDYSVYNSFGTHLTQQLRDQKIDYIVSLGGANGNDLSAACTADQLLAAYKSVIETYQPNGLDFDIENGTAKVEKVMVALKAIQKSYPNLTLSFTLPTLPEGLTAEGITILKAAKASGLNYQVNIMTMDYGPYYVKETMGEYAIDAAKNLFAFLKAEYPQKTDEALWQMIILTPMIGINDTNVQHFTLDDVKTIMQFANQNHLGGLSMWSVARDKPCNDIWASPICSGKDMQTQDYQFMKTFNQTSF